MTYLWDFAENATVYKWFNTVGTDGSPITIGGTATAQVYKNGGTTQITTGVTITEDFDGVTGLHLLTVDMLADAAYTTAADYVAVLSVGTADGVSIVGGCIVQWSCENRRVNAIKDGAIDVDTFAADTLSSDADIATAVAAELGDGSAFTAIPNAVIEAMGVTVVASGTPTTTSIQVENRYGLTNTQADNALILHLSSGAYSRITNIDTGTDTITISPALPAAPSASDRLVIFGQYLASL